MKNKVNSSWRDVFGSEAGMTFVPSTDTARDIRIVSWEELPTWIKGAYSSEDQVVILKSMTWAVGSDGETYFAYDLNGRYVATFAKE